MKSLLKVLAILFILSAIGSYFSFESQINELSYFLDSYDDIISMTHILTWNFLIFDTICVFVSIIFFSLSIIITKTEIIENQFYKLESSKNNYGTSKYFTFTPNTCSKCGRYNPASSYHCSNCGHSLRK